MSITTFTEKPTDEGETEPAKSEPEKGKSNMWDVLLKFDLTRHLKCFLRNAASLFPVYLLIGGADYRAMMASLDEN